MSDTIEFSVPISGDEEGFVGRECPNDGCLGYFKVKLGTGLTGDNLPCHCPYCGHTATHDHFWTQDQVEFVKSVARHKVQDYVLGMLQDVFRRTQPKRKGLIGISWEVKRGAPLPLHQYTEKQLETILVCDRCGLQYAVYGVFAYCPDCGTHNSLQILSSNLELAVKELDLAATMDEPMAGQLVSDALENAVGAFDAFGRECLRVHASLLPRPEKVSSLSCQNPDRLAAQVRGLLDIDIAAPFSAEEWATLVRAFQKRHLIAHKMGVIDDAYIRATGEPENMKGRKVTITPEEVRGFIPLVCRLGTHLQTSLDRKRRGETL